MPGAKKKGYGFPSTMWTDIERWNGAGEGEKRKLIEQFYSRYRLPLLKYINSFGLKYTEADDALHDFMIRHMEGKLFVGADPARGRFRNLLLRALKNFLISVVRENNTAKRRPERGLVQLDEEVMDGVRLSNLIRSNDTVEDLYDRIWLTTVLCNVLESLKAECLEKGNHLHYELLERCVIAPLVSGTTKPEYKILGEQYGITSTQVANHVVTAKRAYQRLLKAEIRQYVSTEKEVNEEIGDFLQFLQSLHR